MQEAHEGRLTRVLREAWTPGFSVSSRFAREMAKYVALAASLNLITTRDTNEAFSQVWRITPKGLRWINEEIYK